MRDLLRFVRGSKQTLLAFPSLSMFHIIEGDLPVHRFKRLTAFLIPRLDAIALAIEDWAFTLHDIFFGCEEDDRDTWNHNPWGFADLHSDPATFEQ